MRRAVLWLVMTAPLRQRRSPKIKPGVTRVSILHEGSGCASYSWRAFGSPLGKGIWLQSVRASSGWNWFIQAMEPESKSISKNPLSASELPRFRMESISDWLTGICLYSP